MARYEDTEEIDASGKKKKTRSVVVDDELLIMEILKRLTSVKAILILAFFFVALGISGFKLWMTKADASQVVELEKRQTALEAHHMSDDVEIQNVHRSLDWTQDTLWKLSQQVNVHDVKAPPTPAPIPSVTPTKGNP